ncbi:MAG: molybdenum cofactor guanylyltransferase [Planctomycetaceae bacterium]
MNAGYSAGGIVLCGGKSSRMQRPKMELPFGNEVLLQRICRILGEVVSPIVVVASSAQLLPQLPGSIRILRDEFDSLGPLAGIATGLTALQDECETAFVASCDVPLLQPDFVRAVIGQLAGYDVAVPCDGQYDHVLAAAYHTKLGAAAKQLLHSGQRRPLKLINESASVRIPVDELRQVDPHLHSLRNANTPDEYAELLALAGFSI